MSALRIDTEYQYRGIDSVVLENDYLRVVVLTGKGADILEFRDKRADVNLLFEAPHNWQPLGGVYEQSVDVGTTWMDHYPGGWQDCLPLGGNNPSAAGAEYGQHGESSLIPWESDILTATKQKVAVRFSCELVRYPFRIEKTLHLDRDSATLSVEDRIENLGTVDLPYVWLQHIAYGLPLVDERARIDLDGATITVDDESIGDSPLELGSTFEWPTGNGNIDMSQIPQRDQTIHDLSYLHDLESGWYAITNPDIDLGVAVSFDKELFESIWCWRAFGGFKTSPFFGREHVLGFELCTGWPATNPTETQGPEGTNTLNELAAGDSVSTTIEISTYQSLATVDEYEQVRR
jgi:galactose mutarotase-like enzyme